MSPEDIEQEAILLHDESEATQATIWKRKGHHCAYIIIKWEDMTEGFYKERVRKLAAKKLEEKQVIKKKRKT